MSLHPWRKGPFTIGSTLIDTEWRSDWKWDRISPHITPLNGRDVLDVGCGNGYHCWRMLGAGAASVLGVDPTRVFHFQFRLFSQWLRQINTQSKGCSEESKEWSEKSKEWNQKGPMVYHLPLTLEAISAPHQLPFFDTIFSMGVLYHRRDPHAHLRDLAAQYKARGGELILETLITPDPEPIISPARYAQMKNIWYIPTLDILLQWIRAAGFKDERLVDLNRTTIEEQRTTEWMRFHSLREALDPQDLTRTVEGYPSPLRATIIARI